MLKRIVLGLTLWTMSWAQSGFDILTTPTDAWDASLGLSLNPIVKATRVITHPETAATLSVWNWVADVQGVYMGIGLNQVYLSFQALDSGDLEHRGDVPTEEPLSTFQYNLFNTGAAYARELGPITLGLGAELLYERSLNASATSLSFNLATAYKLNEELQISAGLSHFGLSGKLDQENTALPTETWLDVEASIDKLSLLGEISTGMFPASLGLTYSVLDKFQLLAGLQLESADPDPRVHPSAGFGMDWANFTLGYSMYQINHGLGPRHFISLFWNY